MPTQTFFNLPEEKRNRIIEAAILEFSTYSFDQASIARIIDKADIPRGSFYQYFENLKDLYKYIFAHTADQKINYFRKSIPQFDGSGFNFFETLRELFVTGLRFANENPKLVAIGNNFLKESNTALKDEILMEQMPKAKNIYAEMIRKGIELKQIDPQVDPVLAMHFMNSFSYSLMDYYEAEQKDNNSLLNEEKLLPLVDKMLYLLANGLSNKVLEVDP